jgi:putative ubiquitin-RnfH superfamily antitoxin RatB of RatAB toxin-antitoxin module
MPQDNFHPVDMITVECAYAAQNSQYLLALQVNKGATITEVIAASGILAHCPELTWDTLTTGIFGEKKALNDLVCPGDRVEIYRSLLILPMEARRRRAPPTKKRKF